MKTSMFTVLAASAAVVSAAPAVKREVNFGGLFGPLSGLANLGGMGAGVSGAGQDATAEFFKLADGVLNVPIDAITKVMKGDPMGAMTGLAKNAAGFVGSLPGDAVKIAGNLVPKGGKN
ncbi:hypothetical protein DCS_05496 [Drechmeria coniospora]|uniref:Uncharacterized protein n=1 Tax=Drechmeria coniospora TaxID=98403 RepID=A0A151GN11_DRECN|nr:hypothetical protein DCS_05496 [Drechmeria coniospora]KYK58480.1 hypothetical protein DCS_05496 [Drechmeria coniospora]ODA83873.1 hypothetical protein RJ55_02389 [Drechmeria coniospora]